MNKDLLAIFEYLEREKGIKREVIISAIEDSLKVAARKSGSIGGEDVKVTINPKTGDIEILVQKKIVEEVVHPEKEISLKEAQELAPDCKVGQSLEMTVPPEEFGRIAAQTARQIIAQKLRGAERDVIYEEYRHRVNEIISGTVKRFIKGRTLVVDLGKVEAILPDRLYPITEKYRVGEKVQALLAEVRDTESGGAEVILSRSHPEFVKQLFIQEVPELADGVVVINKIVREAGYRTKMAVLSTDPKVDPVGTCVGVKGTRIKNIIRELNNEKIDVIPYSDDLQTLLQNALAPIEIKKYKLVDNKISIIVVDDDYPAVLGKRGMNTRLISKLLDKELEVQKISDFKKLTAVQMLEISDLDDPRLDQPLEIEGVSSLIIESLISSGFDTFRKVLKTPADELIKAAPGLNYLELADKMIKKFNINR